MDERRRFDRNPSSIRVEITNPTFGVVIGFARDISDGGASVLLESDMKPPLGTLVQVKFKKVTGQVNSNPVKMKVVYHHRNIVGLMFITEDKDIIG